MTRILMAFALLAAAAGVAAATLARGSDAASRTVLERPAPRPDAMPGPPALPEAATTIQRTFVSTSGSDANPCTPTQPCRSFAVAIANTTAGGEVVALDSGGYGPFTIGKAITVAGAPGAHVAISVFSGTGITVNAGASDEVVLRNLYLTGLGGQDGIVFQAGGTLHVESVVAARFTVDGLWAWADNGRLFVRDSVFRHNGFHGVAASLSRVEIADSRADRNDFGFSLSGGARGSISRSVATGNAVGFVCHSGVVAVISDSVADGNSQGVDVPGGTVTLSAVVLSNNTTVGLRTFGIQPGVVPTARIGGSTVTGNAIGIHMFEGMIETFGDNLVRGNTTDVLGPLIPVAKT